MPDFSEVYECWVEEEPPAMEDVLDPPPEEGGWARHLLETLGFTIHIHEGVQRGDPFHDGSALHFSLQGGDHRTYQHELAHAIVWITYGRPGTPRQWGIGSSPYRRRAAELEILVSTVEWVLGDRYLEKGDRSTTQAMEDAFGPNHREPDRRLTPAMVVEAIRMVDLVLGPQVSSH